METTPGAAEDEDPGGGGESGELLRQRLCAELDHLEREQPLRGTPHYRGHIGGRLAGHIGSNRFVVRNQCLV